jgi:hypothetical protein
MSGISPGYGTLSWAIANDGALTASERVREVAKGVLYVLRTAPPQIRMRLGIRNPRALAYDPDRLPIPDSPIARQAEEECREASLPHVLNHCHRSYAWGMMLAELDGLRPDAELLWVASMLHDLALTERYRHCGPMPCFGARAGIFGRDWARKRGWDEARAATLGDAISLHLNVTVSPEHGPEAQLLQAAAALDVIGSRYWDLAPATIAAVLERHPRAGMKRLGRPSFDAESLPRTRTQLLNRWLLFGTLVDWSPFAE